MTARAIPLIDAYAKEITEASTNMSINELHDAIRKRLLDIHVFSRAEVILAIASQTKTLLSEIDDETRSQATPTDESPTPRS